MWEIIRRNKIKSVIALTIMTIWYCAIYGLIFGFFIYAFYIKIFDSGYNSSLSIIKYFYLIGIIVALVVFIYSFQKKKNSPYEFIGYTMHKSTKSANRQLHNIVEEIVIASGLSIVPKIYILNTDILNAYACGINPKNSSIVVSKGLMEILTRDELQGVIAHEIAHIVNRDTTYLLCSGIMYSISASCTHKFYVSAKRGGKGAPLMFLMGLLSNMGEIICFLLLMFVSRKREYVADAAACIYTRYPKGLADALLKIEESYKNSKSSIISLLEIKNVDCLLKSSFILPLENNNDDLSSTHPSTRNRIKILLNMKTADAIEYERNFRKLNNNKKLLPRSIIKSSKKIQIRNDVIDNVQAQEVTAACALNSLVNDKEIQIVKANENILEENIKKHREIENNIYKLENYTIINCNCGTILKIPDVYKNTIIICPHCNKKHPAGIKVE